MTNMINQTETQYQILKNSERADYIKLCKELNIKVDCKLIEVDGKKVIGYKIIEPQPLSKEEKEIIIKPTINFVINPIPVKEETKLNFILPEVNNDEIRTTFNNYQYCDTCKTECSHTNFRNLMKCNECGNSYQIGV